MAKHKRLISIVTSVLMLVTMTGVTAYATEQNADLDVQDNPAAVEDQVAPENAEVTDEALPEDEVVLNEGEETIAPTMTIDPIDPQTYTGKELKPSPVVKVGETVLSEADYTVSYEHNLAVSTKWPKVIVTGKEGTAYEGQTASAVFRIKAPSVPRVTGLKALEGYKEIKLKWNKVEDADTYLIMRNDKKKSKGWPRDLSKIGAYKVRDGELKPAVKNHPYWENNVKGTVKMYKKYTYNVYAARFVQYANDKSTTYSESTKMVKSSAKTIKNRKCVCKLRIRCTIKNGTTLTSTNGKKHFKLRNGMKIMTDGYGGGKYSFYKKGAHFRFLNVRAKNRKAYYDRSHDYSEAAAEYFINNKDLKFARPSNTSKKYLIWASLYTQQVHVFQKNGSRWEQVKAWDCSSGSASAPSPTGYCSIGKRIQWRHHIQYWNCFSTLNALHGIKPVRYAGYNWVRYLGQIKSNGCIRNENENAEWIWDHCPKGTKVLVF